MRVVTGTRPRCLRAAPQRGDDAGFGLIELLVGMGIFAILAMVSLASFGSVLRVYASSRSKTIAEQVATSCMEQLRAIPYDSLGVVGGNPPGAIQASNVQTVAGKDFTVARSISFVDDPLTGGYQSGANYKKAVCTVSTSASLRPVAQLESSIAPLTQPSRTKGLIKASISDYALNQPVPGVSVQLQTGPDSPRSGITPANGTVPFAALTPTTASGPQAFYDIVPSLAGYTVLRDDRPPSSAAHVQLAASQTVDRTLRMYKPSTIFVHVRDAFGQPYTGAATVVVSSTMGTQSFSTLTGELTVTAIAGEPLVPSLTYTVGATAPGAVASAVQAVVPDAGAYPTTNTKDFTLTMTPSATQPLQVQLRDATSPSTAIPNAVVNVGGGPSNVFVTGTTNASGLVTFLVPGGSSPQYTVTVPAAGIYAQTQRTTGVPPSPSPLRINVPRAGP